MRVQYMYSTNTNVASSTVASIHMAEINTRLPNTIITKRLTVGIPLATHRRVILAEGPS